MSCSIDLILTSCPKYFQNSDIIDIRLSDRNKMIATILKLIFRKRSPKVICYKNYKPFSNHAFRDTILEELSQVRISNK